MSCYFRHMKDVLAETGVEITPDNKKQIDQIIHDMVAVEYKNCSPTWKSVKEHIKSDKAKKKQFIKKLKQKLA